ncbi:JmjC domain-containing histone demethylation protein 2B, putative [Pediculus humanus corporis]|nr:JmjC domain-containing histone demethylation protein 2B, putative [Pediculus humanus corporis]EEB18344.1 JmjC domain-containing histone demethylation protein 2B, putative [Pediculus humanus corporis]
MNIINNLPPPTREEERKRVDEQHQALQHQRILAERQRHDRERFYTAPTRPPSNPAKLDYPPPAHSRPGSAKPAEKPMAHAHTALPKAEPNFSLFGYPNYPPVGLTHEKGRPDVKPHHRPMERDLPNPPPLTADLKSSVIVKNEGKNSHHSDVKSQTHSPKPQPYLTPTTNAHKPAGTYDYRNPTQPPHPLSHHHIEQKHHRPVTHNVHHQRQSPHLPTTEQRFIPGTPYTSKPATVGSYPYPTAPVTAHYSMTASVSSSSKPKVSSPAPPHIYGKPTAGITTGIPVCRTQDIAAAPLPLTSKASPSPYQQVPLHQPPSGSPVAGGPPPPPAHSSRTSTVLDARLYPGPPPGIVSGLAVKPPPQHLGTSPPTASAAPHPASRSSPLQVSPVLHNSSNFQTQPLDLGVSERSSSPKRKGTPIPITAVDAAKKRRNESPQHISLEVPPATSSHVQPLLSRVSEPSPLVAGAATTITTVVNAAAYITPANLVFTPNSEPASSATSSVTITPVQAPARTNSADSTRPSSTGSSGVPTVLAPQARASPVCSSPGLSTGTPIKVTPTSADSDKSNSPGPVKASAYPVHKLKKAWLERHSGEDGTEDNEGVVGSGTCVTLPITLDRGRTTPTISNTTKESVSCGLPNAVNSISKSKSSNTGKANRKPNNKDSNLLNGHVEMSKSSHPDDSSSSDQETRKSPAKRKAKVKKKKKGGKRSTAEDNKKKKVPATPVHSESSDSDKDTGSEKDSDSGASANLSGSKSRAGNMNNSSSSASKEPKKRGRRPKSSKNERDEEPRNKKSRDDPPVPSRDPFRKPPISQLKKTGESFLQDGPCFEVAPKLGKCRECRWTPNQRSKNMPNIFCRFYAFRKLRYTKNGQLAIAGFSDPHTDPSEEDLKLWLPSPDKPPADLDLVMSRFLLQQVGDQFCDLLKQEKEAVSIHMSEDKTIAWKRVVQGVREMCDVCETTLFNFHWACGKCGFVVCLDCYKGRKNGTVKVWGEPGRDRDDFSWLQCTNRQAHEQEKLMLTQIIAGDSLMTLGRKLHEVRSLYNISQYCDCPMSKELKSNGISKDLLKNIIKTESINGIRSDKKESDKENKGKGNGGSNNNNNNNNNNSNATNGSTVKTEGSKNSPLNNWMGDSGGDDKKKSDDLSSVSDSDSDKEENYSTLRELLIRPSHKPNGGGTGSPPPQSPQSDKKKQKNENIDELISSAIEKSMAEMNEERDSMLASPEKGPELKHFVRLNIHKWTERGDSMTLPRRVMTLAESKQLYPGVPHSWLCDGKLLRLNDPSCPNNYKIFQDQWKRGQPVIVRDVSKNLDMSLWHPDSFAEDFGDDKNDLINCMTGKIVPNQPMRKFWEGFEHFSKRLKDERGNPMLLKLKDWPPGEDFAEMLPSRFNDLMKVLPLSEYTHRNGRLNLASRLPECFVRPDLGPKMYNAYGSALHPDKGTTNLHLDISDAVNVMVYVGIPKDGDNEEHIKEAFRAIDEAGCDILTRRRVREKGEFPGALWHIYNARDADKIRDLLNKVAIEKGARLEPHHDPIHDQDWYLDGPLRVRLYEEYGIEGYAIVQCLGDAVFIPAGAPHQVRNLHNCMKVAEDFVSPENVSHCFHMTQEFRDLSDKHLNHEDKLQIKNIIYHAVKDSLSVLMGVKNSVKVEEKTSSTTTSSSSSSSSDKEETSETTNKTIIAEDKIKKESTCNNT